MTRSVTLFVCCLLALALALVLASCTAQQDAAPLPLRHPEEAGLSERPPLCTDCHESRAEDFNFAALNHDLSFRTDHRTVARQDRQSCALCHAVSFCNDCHALQVELKPSDKEQAETFRTMPHRGDYLIRHRIDARIDPTSCLRCHGNPKATLTCTPCHG